MSASNVKTDVIFSPFNDNEFLWVANSLFLYRITNVDGGMGAGGGVGAAPGGANLSGPVSSGVELLCSINNYQSYKLISWYPNKNLGSYAIALHEYNKDQIVVLNLLSATPAPDGGIIMSSIDDELTKLDLEIGRKSLAIQWNPCPSKTNCLAASFEKTPDLSSLLVWDAANPKPLYQLEEYENCCSIAWHPENPDLLFASSSLNHISMFDLKAGKKAIDVANTNFIKGFSIDPKNPFRAVSYDDNKVAIWDLRKFQEFRHPLAFFEEPKQIKKLQFCPAKSNRLAVLTEGSTQVNAYRLEDAPNGVLKEPINYLKYCRNNSNATAANVNTFSWHSLDHNRLLILNSNGFVDLGVAEYSQIGYSINNQLNIAFKDKVTVHSQGPNMGVDIGDKMKKRALKSYGALGFAQNIDIINATLSPRYTDLDGHIVENDESDVKYLWQWCDISTKTFERLNMSLPIGVEKFIGIRNLLIACSALNVELEDNVKNYVFHLCEWNNWNDRVDQLVSQEEYERAACICVFNKNLEKAKDILTNASKKSVLNEYSALSLALNYLSRSRRKAQEVPNANANAVANMMMPINNPGVNAEPQIHGVTPQTDHAVVAITTTPTTIKSSVQSGINSSSSSASSISASDALNESGRIINKLTNPYLKALFAYQIDPEKYDLEIYNDPSILIPDRVCMAMTILKQYTPIIEQISKLAMECIRAGSLYGVLLLGFELTDLFKSYIIRTGDVQTPAVAIINSTNAKVLASKQVDCWIKNYRELLNSWMLWEQRALYDIARNMNDAPKVHVKCSFCSENLSTKKRKNITADLQGANIGMTCQTCQKPSLRCCICSMYMTVDPPKSAVTSESDKMFYWFVFCQKCNHGGHLGHLHNWFKASVECPVMTCNCQCSIKDGISEIET